MRWAIVMIAMVAGCGDNLAPSATGQVLSGNETATCLIEVDGALVCWSRLHMGPEAGELGDPVTGLPARFGEERWREISVGAMHACGIRGDGTLWCWGKNCAGQLGDGTRDSRTEPIQVGSEARWQSVATGGGHSCAIDDEGGLSCWGGLDHGQSDCSTVPMQTPTRVDGTWLQVSSGWYSTFAVRDDGTLWRWVDRDLTDPTPFELPSQVGSSRWRTIATGLFGAYGVRDDGTLAFADAGDASETQIGPDTDWDVAIAARDHGCAIKQEGTLWCWGRNDMGQLGTGTSSEDLAEPIRVGIAPGWTSVTSGWAHSCGLLDGSVHCWGMNHEGELGIGMPYDNEIHRPRPIAIEADR